MVAAILVLTPSAHAAVDQLVKAGEAAEHRRDYGEAIKLYSRAIGKDGLSPAMRAQVLVKRSDSFRAKGLFQKADGDATEAIKLRAGFAEAYNSRGLAHAKMGLLGRAIADYGKAVALRPAFAYAHNNRGRAYFYQGRFRQAAANFEARLKIKPRHVYPMLWLYLARERMGGAGGAELAANTAGLKGGHWIGAVVAFYLGKASREDVLAAARDDDANKQREQEVEANFYLGQERLLAGDEKTAAKYFRAALATGLVGLYEYTGAEMELRRMGIGK